MNRWTLPVLLFLLIRTEAAQTMPDMDSGKTTRGGAGGRTLFVTRLDDDPDHPAPGSLRWALHQKGPRIVKFAVSGTIDLRERIIVREPCLTIDGSDAPREGITINGGSLIIHDTHDIIVRQVRIRLGEKPAARQRREHRAKRPLHSAGLDCVTLENSRRIVFDHCSLSWSCDEIFGITRCRDVVIQWCILSEPLAGRKLHPYGDHHAFPVNASASTLSIHHCLFARFVMRGPQFEASDMRRGDDWPVQMEAVNNVIFGYEHSGSRYGCGVEKGGGTVAGKSFRFQFLNNLYLSDSAGKPPIEAMTRHGVIPNVRVHASGNTLLTTAAVRRPTTDAPPLFAPGKGPVLPASGRQSWREVIEEKHSDVRQPFWTPEESSNALKAQVSAKLLFRTPANVKAESAQTAAARVLDDAGCTLPRDAVDHRIINEVLSHRYGEVIDSAP